MRRRKAKITQHLEQINNLTPSDLITGLLNDDYFSQEVIKKKYIQISIVIMVGFAYLIATLIAFYVFDYRWLFILAYFVWLISFVLICAILFGLGPDFFEFDLRWKSYHYMRKKGIETNLKSLLKSYKIKPRSKDVSKTVNEAIKRKIIWSSKKFNVVKMLYYTTYSVMFLLINFGFIYAFDASSITDIQASIGAGIIVGSFVIGVILLAILHQKYSLGKKIYLCYAKNPDTFQIDKLDGVSKKYNFYHLVECDDSDGVTTNIVNDMTKTHAPE